MGAAPKMNRSAKGGARSSLHYGGEGILIHPPHQGVCGRHSREEQGVTSGGLAESPGGTGVSEPISGCERVSEVLSVVGRLNSNNRRPEWVGEGSRRRWSGREGSQMSKDERGWNSSLKEKPVRSRPRRLVDWINLTGAKKVHSLIDKVYKRKNLEMAWEKVKENRGSGGVDGQSLAAFESQQGLQLARLEKELKEDAYRPQPVLQHPIPKRDKPRFFRVCGSRKTSHAGCPTSSRWPSASPYPSDAQSGKLRESATLSDRAQHSPRRSGFASAQQHTPDAV